LYDDDGTGTDEFKIVVSGLDFGSRIFFSWVDFLAMGKAVFKNYDYGTRRFERIEFERTSDFNNGTSGEKSTQLKNIRIPNSKPLTTVLNTSVPVPSSSCKVIFTGT
jgi:hypothetical protein